MPEVHLWHWFAFGVLVAVCLTLDLAVVHRREQAASWRNSALATLAWCASWPPPSTP